MGMVEMRRFSIPPSGPPVFMAYKEEGHSNHHSSKPRGWAFLPWVISSYQLMDFCRKLALVVLSAILVASIVSLPPVWNSMGSIIKLHGGIAFFQDDDTRLFNEYQDLKNDHGLLHPHLTEKNKYIQNLQHIYRILGQENRPYLCRKDGIFLRCPQVKEPPSLWENPYSATTSWKPCAQRHEKNFGHLPSENETNGYILIHAEGGLNQQRVAICNAVAVAKIINATLILPCLKQDQIWKDQTKFEDVFDVHHFIEYLKYDVPIVRDIPAWFPDKGELFTSIRRTVKNIPKYASADFYIDNVLPRIKEKKIMALKPFVDRLGYDNVPSEINRLRCRVNYHALKFLPDIENMAEILASRMRNRTGTSHPYMALHLRFEKGMVGLSFCDFVGSRSEKAMMAAYRQKEWPRRYKNGSHLWQMALEKRKEGRCPLEPGEVAVLLRAMGYPKETQIYVASGQVYGGQNRMAPLRNMFPNLVTKEELATTEELKPFRKHITSLAALDFLVCLKSDVFVMTHGGNFAKLIIGARRYMGHRLKSIKPNKGLMTRSLGDPFLGWTAFREDIVVSHETRTGLPEPTFPVYDIWENPLSHCMCKV